MGPVRELRVATILDAGRATLELLSRSQSQYVDELDAGRPSSGPVRFALEVEDSDATGVCWRNGAERLGGPVVTPWAIATCGSGPRTACS